MTNATPSRKRISDAKWNVAELPQHEIIDVEALEKAYREGNVDLVTVLGPTASGKTRLAVSLARRINGEIISADSRQVYRGMDIGTGKDLCEYGEIPYHLIDIVPAGTQYNVFEFRRDFSAAYSNIRRRGAVPILCGGTGLYINAVTAGYDFNEKKPLSSPGRRTNNEGMPQKPYFIGTLADRDVRNTRIDMRLESRLKEGMIDEVKALLDSGVPEDVLIAYGLEYRFVTLYLKGEISYDEMRGKLAIAIHQFAKRQMTWFRGMARSGAVIHWTDVSDFNF